MDPEMIRLECDEAMTKAVEYAIHEFSAVRTGKASPMLVENLDVAVQSYGGMHMKLKQLAMISTPEPRIIRIEPFDASTLKDIERAFHESKLGLNPAAEGKLLRIYIPELSSERRQQMVKSRWRNLRFQHQRHPSRPNRWSLTHYSRSGGSP